MAIYFGEGYFQDSGGNLTSESKLKQHPMSLPPSEGRIQKSVSRRVLLFLALFVSLVLPVSAQENDAKQYFVASAAYNRKLYPVAVTQFGEFLQKNPKHAKANLAQRGLGLSLYALKQYDKAKPHFAALLAKPKLDASISRDRILMLQGRCLLYSAKKDEARKLFIDQYQKLADPKYRAAALAAICDICFEKSEWDQVISWTEKLIAAKPTPDAHARGLYQRGYALQSSKKSEEAVAALARIAGLKTTPDWKTRSAYLLGECHNSLGQFDKAEPAFASALAGMSGAKAAECRYRLALVRFLLKKFEAASTDFTAYLKEAKAGAKEAPAPHIQDANLFIGRCSLERDDHKAAERQFGKLVGGEDLVAAKANLWLARTYSRRGDFDRAAGILSGAVKKFSKSPIIDELDFDHANAEMSRKTPDWKLAASALQRVEGRRTFAQIPEVLAQRATCYHMLKDFNNSLNIAQAFLSRFPKAEESLAGDMRYLRAENLYLLNRADESAKAYGEYLGAHKDHPNALAAELRLAQVHHLAGRWEQSLASAKPLMGKNPEGRLFAQLSFIVGDCYFRTGKWAEVIAPLEAFVAARVETSKKRRKVTVDQNLDTGLLQLAIAHDHLKQSDKALDHLLTIVSHYGAPTPHLPLALAEQGRLAYLNKDLKLARSALTRFVGEDKAGKEPFKKGAVIQRPRVMYYLGWVEADDGQPAKAAEYFAKVPRNHELGPDASLQHGIALVNAEDFKAAAKHFPQMLRHFPKHEQLPLVIYYAGLSDARVENWPSAATYFKRVLDTTPDARFADQALYEWAWCERARKRNKEAEELYNRLLEKYPKSQFALKVQSELAELNLDSGAQDMVIASLTKTMETMKDGALKEPLRIQLASAHFKKGDHEVAAKLFEAVLTDYPKSTLRASMLFQAGESRLKLKETVAARDHFAEAFKIGGTDKVLAETITMRLGETQALTDQHQQAAKTYRHFLGSFKESKWLRNAQFGLAYALERGGKPDQAIKEYAKLLVEAKKVDLWTVRGRFQTGECLFNMQKYERATAEFVNIEINFKQYPGWQAKSVLEIGRILLAEGKKEQATQSFKDVIKRYPNENAAVVARQYLDELRK
jgi:TolA-binding protein